MGNIYKGKVDNVLPGLEAAFVDIGLDKNGFLHVDEIVHPGRGAGQARPRHQELRPVDHRPAQARAGDRRAGHQGPAQDQGRAADDGAHHRRAATWSTRRTARASASRAGWRTRSAPACAPRPSSSTWAAAARSSAPRPTARPARTSSASCSTSSSSTTSCEKRVEGDRRAGDGLPGGRPLDPRRPRHLLRALRARDRRRPQAAPPARLLLHAHGARARRPRRAVGGAVRPLRGLRRRAGDRGHALARASTCPAAAT